MVWSSTAPPRAHGFDRVGAVRRILGHRNVRRRNSDSPRCRTAREKPLHTDCRRSQKRRSWTKRFKRSERVGQGKRCDDGKGWDGRLVIAKDEKPSDGDDPTQAQRGPVWMQTSSELMSPSVILPTGSCPRCVRRQNGIAQASLRGIHSQRKARVWFNGRTWASQA